MTADPTTRTAQVREQISALTDQGLDAGPIAAQLGITVSRVNQILDQLDATPPPDQRDQRDQRDQPKQRVQVRWLIPRGATMDGAHLEYAVLVAGRIAPCSFGTAELAAAHDEPVLSRWATDWTDAR